MKTDVIHVDKRGGGFQDALLQTEKAAAFRDLGHKETLQLRLCTEEMLSLERSVTGDTTADFWLESEGRRFDLHLSAQIVMDREKREKLIASATSRKNEAASTFLGKLRDIFEAAMVSEPSSDIPDDVMDDMYNRTIEVPEWDEYEKSILKSVADDVKIAIRGGAVEVIVTKIFA